MPISLGFRDRGLSLCGNLNTAIVFLGVDLTWDRFDLTWNLLVLSQTLDPTWSQLFLPCGLISSIDCFGIVRSVCDRPVCARSPCRSWPPNSFPCLLFTIAVVLAWELAWSGPNNPGSVFCALGRVRLQSSGIQRYLARRRGHVSFAEIIDFKTVF